MAQRLQKLLASAGLGSRRALDAAIAEGRVRLNGAAAAPGAQAAVGDRVVVDGVRYVVEASDVRQRARVVMYHKPVGQVCSKVADREGDSVFEHLPRVQGARWVSVGRLDVNTSGLLLFTDDGELANRLMHPSFEVERIYAVRIRGQVDDGMIQRLLDGVELEDGPARFDRLEVSGGENSNRWFHVSLHEGRNREVRRLWESQGVEVSRLMRLRYGPVTLPRDLARGRWRFLDGTDLQQFFKALDYHPEAGERLVKERPGRRTAARGKSTKPRGRQRHP